MNSNLKYFRAAGLAAVMLGAALVANPAQAGGYDDDDDDIGFRPRVERRVVVEERRVIKEYGRSFHGGHGYSRSSFHGGHGYARPASFGGYRAVHARHFYGRPVYDGGDCRTIIKKRIDPWGDMVVKKIRTCD